MSDYVMDTFSHEYLRWIEESEHPLTDAQKAHSNSFFMGAQVLREKMIEVCDDRAKYLKDWAKRRESGNGIGMVAPSRAEMMARAALDFEAANAIAEIGRTIRTISIYPEFLERESFEKEGNEE